MLSHAVNERGSAKILDSILSAESQNLYIAEIIEGYSLNKAFAIVQQELRASFGILVIGIRHNGVDIINPSDETLLKSGDSIIYLSDQSIRTPYTPLQASVSSTE